MANLPPPRTSQPPGEIMTKRKSPSSPGEITNNLTQSSAPTARKHRRIQPAPLPPRNHTNGLCFYDLPPELRNEIYELALLNTEIHIIPPKSSPEKARPHPLVLTSKQVRNEALPIMHCFCPIKTTITDFNFTGLLEFLARIPPDDQKVLTKNKRLEIWLCTSSEPRTNPASMRKWLHYRADRCRAQPNWKYNGPAPNSRVANDLRRKMLRMTEKDVEGRKKEELKVIMRALKVYYE